MSGGEALARLQAEFAAALVAEGDPGFASRLSGEPSLALRRLAIYRRAVEANRRGALRSAYPVVARLVGEAFFAEAARGFGRHCPQDDSDLNRYGAGFPAFLAAYPHASQMPWLGDVARLEWAWHEALMAADSPGLDFGALARVDEAGQPRIRFRFHAAVRLVRSAWPVFAIWEANQPGRDGTPDRDEGADDVLVWREDQRVRAMLLESPEADFVARLLEGASLEEAAADGWDFSAALGRLAAGGMLAGFAVGTPVPS